MGYTRTSYVCLPCRASYKQHHGWESEERRCPRCAGTLVYAGSGFAAPPRRDVAAWRTVTLLLNAGIGFPKTSCGEPRYRPRTRREVRERRLWAHRSGEPLERALLRREIPWEPVTAR
ncbi:deoxyxylulose-5-phosphate synthase [Kitasatospora sp. NPDC057965]|uniref:deoxyxylulose-5-phosphate synthase n=1 Tax=Kitasatospora sp. NPDC057965 TaxID=3346291 RepID=UPI0036DEBB05